MLRLQRRRGVTLPKRSTWVAWSMLVVFAAGLAFTAVLAILNETVAGDPLALLYLPTFTAFMVVGALVVARRPANAIGWLFSAIGLLALGASLAGEYTQYAYVTQPGALPFAVGAAWYLAWAAFLVFGLTFTFTLLLFPTGRLLSPRWRPVAWLAGIQITATSVLAALQPTLSLEDQGRTIANPIGISGLPDPEQGAVGAVLIGLFTAVSLAACGSVVVRFRRAGGEERQQLKWVAYAAALMVISTVVVGVSVPGGSDLTIALTIVLLPIAAGVAILRYRLYDIDRLINRTLVYGWLTAHPGTGLCRGRPRPWSGVRRGGEGSVELGSRRRHPSCGGTVPAGPPPYPGGGRPALQPAQVQRRPDHRGVLHPPARPSRLGYPLQRAAGGR